MWQGDTLIAMGRVGKTFLWSHIEYHGEFRLEKEKCLISALQISNANLILKVHAWKDGCLIFYIAPRGPFKIQVLEIKECYSIRGISIFVLYVRMSSIRGITTLKMGQISFLVNFKQSWIFS